MWIDERRIFMVSNVKMNFDNYKDVESYCILQEQTTQETVEFLELKNLFECAIDEINTKLEKLADEFQLRFQRNPIHRIESRLKTSTSIIDKLLRKGFMPNIQAAKENLTDIAGVRVICDYIDDIYLIADLLCSQEDISLNRKTDYIKSPKANGYRSLHLVVMTSVMLDDAKELVPVEIQLRSIAMDFWASIEHQIYYKRGCDNVPEALVKRLKACADTLAKIDIEMQDINREMQKSCYTKDL